MCRGNPTDLAEEEEKAMELGGLDVELEAMERAWAGGGMGGRGCTQGALPARGCCASGRC